MSVESVMPSNHLILCCPLLLELLGDTLTWEGWSVFPLSPPQCLPKAPEGNEPGTSASSALENSLRLTSLMLGRQGPCTL